MGSIFIGSKLRTGMRMVDNHTRVLSPNCYGLKPAVISAVLCWRLLRREDDAMQEAPRIAETHTGMVFLVGDKVYKIKKPVVTDFLDFSTVAQREQACAAEVALNSRLAPHSYLGIAHMTLVQKESEFISEPVIVMHRYPDKYRLATMVLANHCVTSELNAIAEALAHFHSGAVRGPALDAEAKSAAIANRWRENITELKKFAESELTALSSDQIDSIDTLATAFINGRSVLFAHRIAERRIVDGHADLLADDIFCLPHGPVILDCLEFDNRLRYVDGIDDAAFLAMDLEFLNRPDLGSFFLDQYRHLMAEDAPISLQHFFIAYRAVVRAKVDCVRYTQGVMEASRDASRHLDIAHSHSRSGMIKLIMVGGAPGTGKTTLAHSLAEILGAEVISTDDVRADMVSSGELTGDSGVFNEGRYTPENNDLVYATLLRRAHLSLCEGRSVIIDGTWSHEQYRLDARQIADDAAASIIELTCVADLHTAVNRIRTRVQGNSEVNPDIAISLATQQESQYAVWPGASAIDTRQSLNKSVAQAQQIINMVSV